MVGCWGGGRASTDFMVARRASTALICVQKASTAWMGIGGGGGLVQL